MTNRDGARNNKMMVASQNDTLNWQPLLDIDGNEIFGKSEDRTLDEFLLFEKQMVIAGREEGMTQLWVVEFEEGKGKADMPKASAYHRVIFPESA